MPTSLPFDDHLEALGSAGSRLGALAAEAGMAAPVPTCPAWDVAALLAHQTMVHRWATAHVTGADPDALPNQTTIRRTVDDLAGHYAEGLAALLTALRDAPADLVAMTFLRDAPEPRRFWARRQAHETTIHMVDALAATLGRVPTADEVAVGAPLAADGIDELLRGFFTRGTSKLYVGAEYDLAVAPTDVDRRWLVRVAPSLTVAADPVDPAALGRVDAAVSGTAAQLYLGLWNRGDEIEATGRPEVLERWRAAQRVTW